MAGELFRFSVIYIHTCQYDPLDKKIQLIHNLYMHWPVDSDPFIWPSNLKRMIYSYSQPMVLGVMAKKVLNTDSISNETNVSCKGYWLLETLCETHDCAYPIHTQTDFSKSFASKENGPVRLSPVHCKSYHSDVSHLSCSFRRGGLVAFCEISLFR